MHTMLRTWLTPGAVVAMVIVVIFWLHQLQLSAIGHECALLMTLGLGFGLLGLVNE
jgi:hypothetical protein